MKAILIFICFLVVSFRMVRIERERNELLSEAKQYRNTIDYCRATNDSLLNEQILHSTKCKFIKLTLN